MLVSCVNNRGICWHRIVRPWLISVDWLHCINHVSAGTQVMAFDLDGGGGGQHPRDFKRWLDCWVGDNLRRKLLWQVRWGSGGFGCCWSDARTCDWHCILISGFDAKLFMREYIWYVLSGEMWGSISQCEVGMADFNVLMPWKDINCLGFQYILPQTSPLS